MNTRLFRGARLAGLGLLVALAFAALAPAHQVPASPIPAAELDAHVARVMKAFDVPGLALAVVKDDAVVVARGYGVRRM